MLKKRDLHDSHVLYELMVDPAVFPFVRQKAYSYEEYLFLTKQTIEAEERGELISRTILDEWGNPIGTITLFDVQEKAGHGLANHIMEKAIINWQKIHFLVNFSMN